ncbi:MAG TPA: AMP phosphorylase [Methanocorpusculum sp.]|nr:AMP phosphorylase [Methanocorpusculum sp.]
MKLNVNYIDTPELFAYISECDATPSGIRQLTHITLANPEKHLSQNAYAILAKDKQAPGEIYISKELKELLEIEEGNEIEITLARPPKSISAVHKKISGEKLTRPQIAQIIEDLHAGALSPLEITAFITAVETRGFDMDETEAFAREMIASGDTIKFNQTPIVDHHSIGGVPGNKVTLLVVPIIAAAGLLVPKTCSRAITGAGGTADLMEAIAPVAFSSEEIKKMTEKAGAVIVWGGATNLVPADDYLVNFEKLIDLNPHGIMLASILSKKKAAGSDICVLDIPVGWGTKVNTPEDARALSHELIELGRRLGIKVECMLTFGDAPVGRTIGVNLEVAEALKILEDCGGSGSLMQKSCALAGAALEMAGKAEHGKGMKAAEDLVRSGKAYQKMKDIIAVQGGNPEVKSADLKPGKYTFAVRAPYDGRVVEMNNRALVKTARLAGAPADHGAGIYFNKKTGEPVKKGEALFKIYADNENKLSQAVEYARTAMPLSVNSIIIDLVQ